MVSLSFKPSADSRDVAFIEFARGDEKDDKADDGAAQFPWDAKLQLQGPAVRPVSRPAKMMATMSTPKGCVCPRMAEVNPSNPSPTENPVMMRLWTPITSIAPAKPGQGAADQHGADGGFIAGHTAKSAKRLACPAMRCS